MLNPLRNKNIIAGHRGMVGSALKYFKNQGVKKLILVSERN